MRARPIVAFFGFVASVIVVSGCTSGIGGTASPTTSSGQATASDGPGRAPVVAHPLDAAKMVAAPCTALTAADVASLQVVNAINGGPDRTASAVQCGWTGSPGGSVGIGWETANTGGLSDLYALRSTVAYWQPTTVSGYPAVYGDALSDGRSQGDCVISVGVNDHLYFIASFNNPANAGPSCTLAAQAAADVIRNLEGS